MAISVIVAIPWRYQEQRVNAYKRVRRFWDEEFPRFAEQNGYPHLYSYTVAIGDSDPERHWNLARARNQAVRNGCNEKNGYHGSLVISDADTIPEPQAICDAIHMQRGGGISLVYPYTQYRYLNQADAWSSTDRLKDVEPIWSKPDSVGGTIVTDTDWFWAVRGYDDRFADHWGFEDNAMDSVARTLGHTERIDGPIYSFAHEVSEGRDWSPKNPNYHRAELYRMCEGRPELMRELVK